MTPSETPDRLIGDRYRLEQSIGSGGMGTVWRARDELLGRLVAVKEVRFPSGLSAEDQDDLRERTLREARASARLSHPNVVTTYDVVEEDGRPWIVMELLPTRTLSEVLRDDGALPPHRVAEIGLGMLSALTLSHQQGVVHRDVKPGNVLITDEGRAVLTDFGIATMAGDPSLTSTGVVLGSPAYMSPERARGQRPGAEADLWSLGATLYAAAEGRPPFDADNALGTLTAVISDPVTPPTVDGPLREAILGLLEKDPADRLDAASTKELLTRAAADHSGLAAPMAATATVALDRASRTEALPLDSERRAAAPPPPPPRPYETVDARDDRPTRRRPSAAVVAMVLLLLLLGVIGVIALMNDEGNNDPTTADPSPSRSQQSTPPKSSPSKESTQESTQETSPSETNEEQGAPAGFVRYEDPTGFALNVPEDWAPEDNGTAVDFKSADGAFLRIDQTDEPKDDPKADWEQQEQDRRGDLPNYQRVRIDEVDYRDWPAADWEFTFGENTHVLNRGFVTGPKGYAIYLSSPEGAWEENQAVFETAAESFKPAGG